ncbi:hypothetical protein BDV96DRAFT_648989 [Lophiotrema nucula]|uniref:RING-type domain-containing protein n=1 Tax=Lophiotrema nucula TaxID=690887 RepID=A0A6A5Z357_9PLEO|nr:hypothetical protein BDV96DRAFT_648989 [Lophiotrema nucula]
MTDSSHFIIRPSRDVYVAGLRPATSAPDDESCAICLEAWNPSEVTVAAHGRHIFHQICLLEWLNQPDRDTCPVCRDKLFDLKWWEADGTLDELLSPVFDFTSLQMRYPLLRETIEAEDLKQIAEGIVAETLSLYELSGANLYLNLPESVLKWYAYARVNNSSGIKMYAASPWIKISHHLAEYYSDALSDTIGMSAIRKLLNREDLLRDHYSYDLHEMLDVSQPHTSIDVVTTVSGRETSRKISGGQSLDIMMGAREDVCITVRCGEEGEFLDVEEHRHGLLEHILVNYDARVFIIGHIDQHRVELRFNYDTTD